jgi:transcriptional regulator with XRE-family HTH domain
MNILENIKVLRLQKRLSQLDMAEALAISQGAYAQLENGKTEITLNRIEQLAKLFGMTTIELLQYGGETVQQPQIVDNEKVKELEREIKDLKEKNELLTQLREQAKDIATLKLIQMSNLIGFIAYNHPEIQETITRLENDIQLQSIFKQGGDDMLNILKNINNKESK